MRIHPIKAKKTGLLSKTKSPIGMLLYKMIFYSNNDAEHQKPLVFKMIRQWFATTETKHKLYYVKWNKVTRWFVNGLSFKNFEFSATILFANWFAPQTTWRVRKPSHKPDEYSHHDAVLSHISAVNIKYIRFR